jgi:hypothetical protein
MFTDLHTSFIEDGHSSSVCPIPLPVSVKNIFDKGCIEKWNAFYDDYAFCLYLVFFNIIKWKGANFPELVCHTHIFYLVIFPGNILCNVLIVLFIVFWVLKCDFFIGSSLAEYDSVVESFPFHDQGLEQMPFPKKFPFSPLISNVCQEFKEFIYTCLKFSEDLSLR